MRKLILAGLGLALLTGCGPKSERPAPPDTLPATTPQAATDTSPTPTAVAPAKPESTPAPPAPAPVKQPTAVASPKPAPKPTPKPAATTPTPPPPAPAPTAAAAPDPYHPAPRDTLDVDTYQGWKQYELNCSRCHGEYAVGTSFAPALVVSLKADGTIPTKEMFITTVCAGRLDKGMPSWCALGLEMNKIEEIYQYVKGRADGKISAGRPAQRE